MAHDLLKRGNARAAGDACEIDIVVPTARDERRGGTVDRRHADQAGRRQIPDGSLFRRLTAEISGAAVTKPVRVA